MLAGLDRLNTGDENEIMKTFCVCPHETANRKSLRGSLVKSEERHAIANTSRTARYSDRRETWQNNRGASWHSDSLLR